MLSDLTVVKAVTHPLGGCNAMIQTVHFTKVEAQKLNKVIRLFFIVASVMEQEYTGHLREMILILMIATTVQLSSWS